MTQSVVVVPHNPGWAQMFQHESQLVLAALGANALAAHHIGSTAIPTIVAKPVIDILIAVAVIDGVETCNRQMELLGYEVMGEYGIPTRRYFRKDDPAGTRTHHVHVFPEGSPQVARHLAFRDFMLAHPSWAAAYGQLKSELAARHPDSIQDYHEGKSDFIRNVDRLANAWRRGEEEPQ